MTCVNCGGAMRSAHGSYRYTEAGPSNVLLVNVETRQCPACGECELVTPRVHRLHRAMARALSRQAAPLTPDAIRFLRKWLGLTIQRFAQLMGVGHGTVCRWERVQGGYPLTAPADRLLKLLVAQHKSADPYPLDLFTSDRRAAAAPIVLVAPEWIVDEADRAATAAPAPPSTS